MNYFIFIYFFRVNICSYTSYSKDNICSSWKKKKKFGFENWISYSKIIIQIRKKFLRVISLFWNLSTDQFEVVYLCSGGEWVFFLLRVSVSLLCSMRGAMRNMHVGVPLPVNNDCSYPEDFFWKNDKQWFFISRKKWKKLSYLFPV